MLRRVLSIYYLVTDLCLYSYLQGMLKVLEATHFAIVNSNKLPLHIVVRLYLSHCPCILFLYRDRLSFLFKNENLFCIDIVFRFYLYYFIFSFSALGWFGQQ